MLNLLRLSSDVGYRIDAPLPVPPVFDLIASRGAVAAAEMYEVFNMGCGFCAVVREGDAETAVAIIEPHHPGAAVVGHVTDRRGSVELPRAGLAGAPGRGFGSPDVGDAGARPRG